MFYVKNVPGWERIIRVLLGSLAIVLAIVFLQSLTAVIVSIAAIGIVASGLVGFCPACALVGRKLARQQARR
ncbi:YgaP family membrane protein [Paraburkholderia sp. GAS32]|uniref:YgaP family membrane protein n=1 Tax=Paraburkholderia sp. GAS32 TaxID=3035129 RepID=UPI003D1F6B43